VRHLKGIKMSDFAARDLHFALGHHLLVFALAGILAFEIGAVRAGMGGKDILRVARADAWYGILAAAIIAVGFSRAVFAAKGWAYYSVNLFFWAKIAAFAVVGLLSIFPTMAYLRWRRRVRSDSTFFPSAEDAARVKRILWLEVAVFAFIPLFAAAMARGYGAMG
jgi:putative membrane protein